MQIPKHAMRCCTYAARNGVPGSTPELRSDRATAVRAVPGKLRRAGPAAPRRTGHVHQCGGRRDLAQYERRLVESETWRPPAVRLAQAAAAAAAPKPVPMTVDTFARMWLRDLERPAPRRDYDSLMANHIVAALGTMPVEELTRRDVRQWWSTLEPTKPRARSKAFQLLHNVMAGAVESELVDSNPVAMPSRTKVRTKRAKIIEPLTVAQVADLARAMPARLARPCCWAVGALFGTGSCRNCDARTSISRRARSRCLAVW